MKASRISIAVVLMVALGLVGCGHREGTAQPPKAKSATVQFRRDILGASRELPVPPTTDVQNGASVSVSGKLLKVNREWVVLEQDKKVLWIPRDNVLLIRIN